MTHLELISHKLCPFLQRAAIALMEKGVPFKTTRVDLSNRPEWFREISPLGVVPLLRVDGTVLFDASAILEYLEDTQGLALHPTDPLVRAQHRYWVEFASGVIGDIWRFQEAQDAVTMLSAIAVLHEKFERLEDQLGAGPYFSGHAFSLVDAAFGPVFCFWNVFDQIGDFGVFDYLPKMRVWRRALAERPSVRGAVDADFDEALLRDLMQRRGHLASLMRQYA